jgi:hypothetical protein
MNYSHNLIGVFSSICAHYQVTLPLSWFKSHILPWAVSSHSSCIVCVPSCKPPAPRLVVALSTSRCSLCVFYAEHNPCLTHSVRSAASCCMNLHAYPKFLVSLPYWHCSKMHTSVKLFWGTSLIGETLRRSVVWNSEQTYVCLYARSFFGMNILLNILVH